MWPECRGSRSAHGIVPTSRLRSQKARTDWKIDLERALCNKLFLSSLAAGGQLLPARSAWRAQLWIQNERRADGRPLSILRMAANLGLCCHLIYFFFSPDAHIMQCVEQRGVWERAPDQEGQAGFPTVFLVTLHEDLSSALQHVLCSPQWSLAPALEELPVPWETGRTQSPYNVASAVISAQSWRKCSLWKASRRRGCLKGE